MKKILLSDLRDVSLTRPPGYYEELVSRGRIETAEILILEDSVYAELQNKFSPRFIIQSIPRKDWPIWAKSLVLLSKPEDKGVGDVVARTIGAENSEAFKKFYKATFGKDCGCNGRQKLWNIKYPLNSKAT